MGERPYTILNCSISLDGYLDDASEQRLMLSTEADLDRVDAVRATCDAILVGAATVRNDNPKLLVRAQNRRDDRVIRGLPESPLKVTVTRGALLDPQSAFFLADGTEKLVYCAHSSVTYARHQLGSKATVIDAGHPVQLRRVTEELYERGVTRLLVEGGGTIHTQFLSEGLADELQLVVAPIFVGDSKAVRFVNDGLFPWTEGRRAELVDVSRIDDQVLLRYALSARFCRG